MANRPAALGVVALCVVALGVAAAGLPALTPEPPAESGVPESEDVDVGDVNHSGDGAENPTPSGQSGDGNRSGIVPAFRGVVDRAIGGLPRNLSGGAAGGSGGSGAAGPAAILALPQAVLAVAGLVIAAAFLTLRSVDGSIDETGEDVDDATADERDAAIAAAAGRAADAVADTEAAALPNAVYRAWFEMTAALDVDGPETVTPGEFAAAARDAGLDREAVADLTAVFEAVRYGDEPAADYEEQALAALRRIEADASGVDASAVDRDGGDGE